MNILLIGSGGREHALAWKLRQSPLADTIFCAPGNPGMKGVTCIDAKSNEELVQFALKNNVELTMVGPEAPLCDGIVDLFRQKGLRIVGPDKYAAQLEGSKSFAKDFMKRHGLPTAKAEYFENAKDALSYVRKVGAPVVIKADGLAAGKGVTVALKLDDAIDAVNDCFDGLFGKAGARVLIEECLFGEEASIIAFCDGNTIVPLASSQDHKRALDGDKGPNTGGMGAYSPAPVVTDDLWKIIYDQVLNPFLKGVQQDKLNFRGVIYAGLMITDKGPKVLEFNVRFGDPETQAILARLDSDLVQALCALADGKLAEADLKWSDRPAVCVVITSKGYPGSYEKGKLITGLDDAEATGAVVFHAGTKSVNGNIVTAGGRVLGVTSLGDSIKDAVDKAYKAVEKISFDGATFRTDIAHRALNK